MPDRMTKAQRSYCMSQIKCSGTRPELILKALIETTGAKHVYQPKGILGKPDFLFDDEQILVFLHGDFWHGWQFRKLRKRLKGYWLEKIIRNRKRDKRNCHLLIASGWQVVTLWEHQVYETPKRCIEVINVALMRARDRKHASTSVLHLKHKNAPGNQARWS
jgi:DNA mismatch endonuclease, patch repair protein